MCPCAVLRDPLLPARPRALSPPGIVSSFAIPCAPHIFFVSPVQPPVPSVPLRESCCVRPQESAPFVLWALIFSLSFLLTDSLSLSFSVLGDPAETTTGLSCWPLLSAYGSLLTTFDTLDHRRHRNMMMLMTMIRDELAKNDGESVCEKERESLGESKCERIVRTAC